MGKIVGAFATSHIFRDTSGVEAQAERVMAGFNEIRRRLEAASPDVIVIIADDHLTNFFLDNMPAFCLGIGEELIGFGDAGIPKHKVRVPQEFARSLLSFAIESGFDLAYSEELYPDHGTMLPLHYVLPAMDVPVVALIQNCFSPPLPTPRRCYQLGGVIKEFIDSRPASEKVALIATGGLSHWLGVEGMGNVDEDFDRGVLEAIVDGRAYELANRTYDEIMAAGGNGGQELRNWLTMLGAVRGCKGELIYYEAMPAWMTGMAAVAMTV
jgi:hypothetical protein